MVTRYTLTLISFVVRPIILISFGNVIEYLFSDLSGGEVSCTSAPYAYSTPPDIADTWRTHITTSANTGEIISDKEIIYILNIFHVDFRFAFKQNKTNKSLKNNNAIYYNKMLLLISKQTERNIFFNTFNIHLIDLPVRRKHKYLFSVNFSFRTKRRRFYQKINSYRIYLCRVSITIC